MGSSKFIVDVEFNNGIKDSLVLLGETFIEIIDYLVCLRTVKRWTTIQRLSDGVECHYDQSILSLDVLRSLRDEISSEHEAEKYLIKDLSFGHEVNLKGRTH